MDPRIQKLRDAGFTDKDIEDYLATSPPPSEAAASAAPADLPSVSLEVPATAPADVPAGMTGLEAAGTVASAVAPYVAPAAIAGIGGLGAYGLYKFGSKALDVGQGISEQMSQRNAIEAAREARLTNRPGFGGTPTASAAPAQPRIVVPESAGGVPRPVAPAPAPAPAAPATAAAEARAPGLVQQGMDMARKIQQLAFEKVMQGGRAAGETMLNAGRAAAPYARAAAAPVAVGLTAALMPGNAGGTQMMIPQKGPYRGMEINPNTGRPWTAEELAVINR